MPNIKDSEIGGNDAAIHFHEDGAFIRASLPTGTAAVYSEAMDLGENLGAITVRVKAESAITGLSATSAVSFAILGGNDKNADATSTDWETLATITAEKDFKAGETIGAFTPPPATHKKYYKASVTNGAGATGSFSVWNELTR